MMSNHQTDSSGRKAALEEQDDKLDSDMVILDTLLDARLASELGIWQTVRQNKNAILYAALACCGVMSEGSVQSQAFAAIGGAKTDEVSYQMVLQSALPVNVGFVSNMGIDGLGAGKGRALDPLHVAAWSGEPHSLSLFPSFTLTKVQVPTAQHIYLRSCWLGGQSSAQVPEPYFTPPRSVWV